MAIASELNITTSATALDMANAIFGTGIQVVSATYAGATVSSGTFSGALSTLGNVTSGGLVSSDTGVILSTGNVADFTNSSGSTNTNEVANRSTDTTASVDGDAQLNAVAGQATFDGAILTANFIPTGDMITMQFVFSSEEFPEYISSNVNDAFGVWVNGTFVPVTITTAGNVAIDEINQNKNSNLYRNNTADQFNTEMDGVTRILSFKAPVNQGQVNTIKIGIADGGDAIYDSNLLIMGDSVQTYALALDDTIQLTPNSSRTFDILANDRDISDSGLQITHLNGTAVVAGQTVTLGTGEKVRLNADGTVTVFSDGDVTTSTLNYTIVDGAGNTDVGFITIRTVATRTTDGIVQGTSGADTIQVGYLGDPDGDRIDNYDGKGVGGTTGDADYIMAGAGNDSIVANLGNDVIYAGTGDDTAFGGAGDDWASLGDGNDSFGTYNADSEGNDTIYGEAGRDYIITGGQNDILYGGDGNDTLSGGVGNDTLYGNDDADQFNITDDDQGDTILGGEGGLDQDLIAFANYATTNGVNVTYTGAEAGTYAFFGTASGTTGIFSEVEAITATVYNDRIDATGNTANSTYYAIGGDDTIDGGAGAETIYADDGNDVVNGGGGNDLLYGGAGNDIFATYGSGLNGNDTIDGGDGYDVIDQTGFTGTNYLSFSGIEEIRAGDNTPSFDWSTDTISVLYYGGAVNDTATAGSGNDTLYGGTGNDSLNTGDGNDQASGGDGNDTITGGIGADALDGGGDADVIYGTAGDTIVGGETVTTGTDNDTLVLNYADVQSITYAAGGNEAGTVNFYGGGTLSFTGIETIAYTGAVDGTAGNDSMNSGYTDAQGDIVDGADGLNDTILGYGGNDSIIAGQGNDIVFGGTGNDTMYGGTPGETGTDALYGDVGNDMFVGAGGDTLYGGAGNDIFNVYTSAGVTGTTTIVGGEEAGDRDVLEIRFNDGLVTATPITVTYTGDEAGTALRGDTIAEFSQIEWVSTGSGNDLINAAENGADGSTYYLGLGDDTVYGGAGGEVIAADAGNDLITAAAGNDQVYGGQGNDTVYGDLGNDTIYAGDGEDKLVGGEGDDTLGGEAGTDLLFGGAGADSMTGGADADTFHGGAGDTVVGGETFTTGTDNDVLVLNWADVASITYSSANNESGTVTFKATSGGGTLTFSEIETIAYTGAVDGTAGDDQMSPGYTDAQNDQVDGLDGANDTILGYGGNDSISAGQGDDMVYGDTGNDTVVAGAGNDWVYGGTGNDTVVAGAGNDVVFLQDGDDSLGGWSQDDSGNDLLYGGNGDDTINGGDGADVVQGDAGNDQLIGSSGDDTLIGGDGNDRLFGGVGNDISFGGAGNDTLQVVDSDQGETLYGGTQTDHVQFSNYSSAAGVNVTFTGEGAGNFAYVATTGAGSFSEMESFGLTEYNDTFNATASTSAVTIGAGGGNDEVFTGAGNDTVAGDAGVDQIYGGDGADQLYGGADNDYMQGDAGNDLVDGGTGDDFLRGDTGNDLVDGGEGNDSVYGGADSDTVYGGDGNDQVYGGFGEDTVYGGTGDDSVTGSGGSDVVHGDDGNDFIQGSDGNDTLYGGAGADTMLGEEDADIFYGGVGDYVDGYETVTTGADDDTLHVSDVAYIDWDLLNPENGTVHFIGGGVLQFYNIERVFVDGAQVFPPDFIVEGTAGNDVIDAAYTGDPEGDRIDAADNLSGNNDDLVQAGAGNDSVLAGDGNDSVLGEDGDDSLYGGVGDDTLIGGSGNDALYGGGDADRFVIDTGIDNDTIVGGETGLDRDTIDLGNLGTGVTVTFTANEAGRITAVGTEGTTFSQIEHLELTAQADLVDATATTAGVLLDTHDGNDTVLGGQGADTVSLGAGDDRFVLANGFGADSLIGGEGAETTGDTLVLDGVTGAVTVDLTAAAAGTGSLTQGGVTATFQEFENITLSDSAVETIVLADGSGTDAVASFEAPTDNGDGTFTGVDRLDVSGLTDGSGDPVNTDDVTVSDDGNGNAVLTFPNGETLILIGVPLSAVSSADQLAAMGIPYAPNLIVDGTSDSEWMDPGYTDMHGDQIDGSDGDDDTIYGYVGNDVIFAGDGNDLVYGGADSDAVFGDAGNDTLSGDAGDDLMDGDIGDDLLVGGEGIDTMVGDVGNDTLYGGSGDDSMLGGKGHDWLHGEQGNDTINGGDGNDTIDAGENDDLVAGGAGDDLIHGLQGNDSLSGDAGNDTLTGGDGNDMLQGGDDRDSLFGGIGDVVDGGEGGDDHDVLDLTAWGHPATNILYDSNNPENGTVEFLDADGMVIGTMTFTNIEKVVACFTPGSMVLTDQGEVAVEDLQPGDRVLTRDNGFQTIRWAGQRGLSLAELIAEPRFNPVSIAKGALGGGLPERDMRVSPQHRMLITGPRAELLFGEHEVLVAAKHLVGLPGIEQRLSKGVSYIHILFDNHEIIRADGAWTESFQPAEQTLDGLDSDQRDEIIALFPELTRGVAFPAARLTLKAKEARLLIRG